ncbi:hypothetical protein LCGC14_1405790 [marine sediment metagenome]|uniref:Uncharacterized protein n=1 Tax=marine sediment metagenome TaxID=412755 RepID=A0A0F9JVR0_9ZZZZ
MNVGVEHRESDANYPLQDWRIPFEGATDGEDDNIDVAWAIIAQLA